MPKSRDVPAGGTNVGVLLDLLMAVMDSVGVWSAAAGDRGRGLAWRDAVTARMIAAPLYVPYEGLVRAAAVDLRLPDAAVSDLFDRWPTMSPWPDAAVLTRLNMRYAFVTNCSTALATAAVDRSDLDPAFTLTAEEAGCYKPNARIYQLACLRLGTTPGRTLFVAGAPYDGVGARKAGLDVAIVNRRPDRPTPPKIKIVESLAEIVTAFSSRPPRR
jgi:2-haloalkanoic acid dehalogenase type II